MVFPLKDCQECKWTIFFIFFIFIFAKTGAAEELLLKTPELEAIDLHHFTELEKVRQEKEHRQIIVILQWKTQVLQ